MSENTWNMSGRFQSWDSTEDDGVSLIVKHEWVRVLVESELLIRHGSIIVCLVPD